jgi:hypothetical protein
MVHPTFLPIRADYGDGESLQYINLDYVVRVYATSRGGPSLVMANGEHVSLTAEHVEWFKQNGADIPGLTVCRPNSESE